MREITLTCAREGCGVVFITTESLQKYCSEECRQKAYRLYRVLYRDNHRERIREIKRDSARRMRLKNNTKYLWEKQNEYREQAIRAGLKERFFSKYAPELISLFSLTPEQMGMDDQRLKNFYIINRKTMRERKAFELAKEQMEKGKRKSLMKWW